MAYYRISLMKDLQLITKSAEETEAFARSFASKLKGGEVIELTSDLGGGKTTFTRGLVAGLGSNEVVASPTFTISREYSKGRLRVYHFDFYRLDDAGIIADELAEVTKDQAAIIVIEWADIVQYVLPEKHIRIQITATGEQTRNLHITCPDTSAYLLEGLR